MHRCMCVQNWRLLRARAHAWARFPKCRKSRKFWGQTSVPLISIYRKGKFSTFGRIWALCPYLITMCWWKCDRSHGHRRSLSLRLIRGGCVSLPCRLLWRVCDGRWGPSSAPDPRRFISRAVRGIIRMFLLLCALPSVWLVCHVFIFSVRRSAAVLQLLWIIHLSCMCNFSIWGQCDISCHGREELGDGDTANSFSFAWLVAAIHYVDYQYFACSNDLFLENWSADMYLYCYPMHV